MNKSPRAIAYIRVSAIGKRGDDLMSPAIQLSAIKTYCDRQGYRLVRTLEDLNKTGKLWKSRQIGEAVTAIQTGTADVVVAWKVSRVCRNTLDWYIAADKVKMAGGRMESATEPTDATTPIGRFTTGQFVLMAELESGLIGAGWTNAHIQRFETGLHPSGAPPFGWRKQPKPARGIEPDDERAAVVAELYGRYLSGQGFHQLTSWLNGTGHPPLRANRWHPNTVRNLLDNPVHAGFVTYKDGIMPGAHEPIITADMWALYQATRRDARRVGALGPSRYLLSGLLRCGQCGHAMTGTPIARYVCQHAISTGAHLRSSTYCAAVDAQVIAWLADQAEQVNADAQLDAAAHETLPTTTMGEQEIVRLDRQLAELTRLVVAGVVAEREYVTARDELTARRAELAAGVQQAADRAVMLSRAPRAADLLADWDAIDLPSKRAALRALIHTVTVTCGKPLDVHVEPAN